ncbi:MAG: hypothetical protein HN576_00560 [Bacteriovoracaceae bacterium]|jgi:hypothetical protein|nr:hypothetical protein [Bacteriovoracaceae bacterium]
MNHQLKNLLTPLIITIIILILLEIISTVILPIVGLKYYILPFNILVILFLGFKVRTPFLAFLILILQYFHSFFTIEGWESGTIVGIFVCILIAYLKEFIHFSSKLATMLVTQIFQTCWFLLSSSLIYLRASDLEYISIKFWRFLPESILISILSPFIFSLLEKIWDTSEKGMLGGES